MELKTGMNKLKRQFTEKTLDKADNIGQICSVNKFLLQPFPMFIHTPYSNKCSNMQDIKVTENLIFGHIISILLMRKI